MGDRVCGTVAVYPRCKALAHLQQSDRSMVKDRSCQNSQTGWQRKRGKESLRWSLYESRVLSRDACVVERDHPPRNLEGPL
jgi:hypothetical protein